MPFWKMLKQGYDHFEVTRLEPKIDVCERRYVFDAESNRKFSAADRCPAYKVPDDIAAAVRDKQRRDDIQVAELVNRGTPTVPVRMGVDGGMNPTFLAAVKSYGGPGTTIKTAAGTIPAHVNPPAETTGTTGSTMSLASTESRPAAAPRSSVQVAAAGSGGGIGSFFSNLFGSKGEEEASEARPAAAAAAPKAKPAASKPTQTAAARSKPEPRSAEIRPKPSVAPAPQQEANAAPPAKPASASSLLSGAAPTVPAGGFEGRFGAWR
jgi:hypothetical protein